MPASCAFVLALACAASPAQSGVNFWTPLGPNGGSITALAASPVQPGLVYAGSNGGGVFRSQDGGATWTRASRGIDPYVLQLVADPVSPSTVYEVSQSSMMRSLDAGTTWTRLGTSEASGLLDQPLSLAIDPRTPSTLYVGGSNGIWRSTDAGATWTPLTESYRLVATIAVVSPTPTSTVVYAFANDPGILVRSTDGGTTWSEADAGLPCFTEGLPNGLQLAVDPSRPANVYVSYLDSSNVGSFQRSTDMAESWSVDPNPAGYPLAVGSGLLYAGNAVSTDGGATWTVESPAPGTLQVLAAGAGTAQTVFAGTTQGVWKSPNAGASWQAASQGLTATQIAALAVDPVHPRILYAAVEDPTAQILYLLRSGNGGQSWRPIGSPPLNYELQNLVIDPVTPTTLYAASSGGVAKSLDSGNTWTQLTVSAVEFCNRVSQLTIDPAHPDTLYAGTGIGGPPWCPALKSTDGGESWSPLPLPATAVIQIFQIVVAPSATETLYAIGSVTAWKSTNAGATWKQLRIPRVSPVGLAVDPTNASRVFMAAVSGIFGTTDGGKTWIELDHRLPLAQFSFFTPPTALAIDPRSPNIVYTGGAWGIYRSTNGGLTWYPIVGGLPVFSSPLANNGFFVGGLLVLDPRQEGKLYAGTAFDGVYAYTVQ